MSDFLRPLGSVGFPTAMLLIDLSMPCLSWSHAYCHVATEEAVVDKHSVAPVCPHLSCVWMHSSAFNFLLLVLRTWHNMECGAVMGDTPCIFILYMSLLCWTLPRIPSKASWIQKHQRLPYCIGPSCPFSFSEMGSRPLPYAEDGRGVEDRCDCASSVFTLSSNKCSTALLSLSVCAMSNFPCFE